MKSKRSKLAKTSSKARENSEPIPTDLLIEILSRLPIKSVARCRCVSNLWRSIIALPYLTELFTARASSHPQLLFVSSEEDNLVFHASPQPRNLDYDTPTVTATHLSRVPFRGSSCSVSSHVQGLVCLRVIRKRKSPVYMICNPSSGQALTLPKLKRTSFIRSRMLLGYDPVDNQFKVLSLTRYTLFDQNRVVDKCQVLTLGTGGGLKWRTITCSTSQESFQQGVCINGVLYYPVCKTGGDQLIGCFHVRSETFSFIQVEASFSEVVFDGTLINYNGKLASLISHGSRVVDRDSSSIKLFVIGDFEKQEWSRHKYVLPPMWEDVAGSDNFRLVGFVGTNEVVLSDASKVIYYDVETQDVVRVGIQGMEASSEFKFATFLNHVEDLKLTQAFK